MESLKTREMTQPWEGRKHMWKIVCAEGPAMLYRGWTRLFTRQAITWSNYLLVYDQLRSRVVLLRNGDPVTTIDKIAMSALTGATACIVNTPFDMIRAQIQKFDPLQEKSMLSALRKVSNTHGLAGLYRSLPTRICRSTWYSVATFAIMDRFDALPKWMKL